MKQFIRTALVLVVIVGSFAQASALSNVPTTLDSSPGLPLFQMFRTTIARLRPAWPRCLPSLAH